MDTCNIKSPSLGFVVVTMQSDGQLAGLDFYGFSGKFFPDVHADIFAFGISKYYVVSTSNGCAVMERHVIDKVFSQFVCTAVVCLRGVAVGDFAVVVCARFMAFIDGKVADECCDLSI